MSGLPHPDPLSRASFSAAELAPGDAEVLLLDQRELPAREIYLRLRSAAEVARAIREMAVRGAPAIGIAAAYGVVLAARDRADLVAAGRELAAARPTAVNLAWAVGRMLAAAARVGGDAAALAAEARAIHREDVAACEAMGRLGAERVPDGATILTHCNAGALATGGFGTALGVVRAAWESGKRIRVLADETRPWLQGARLTAWELARLGIPVEVLPDAAAASLFARGEITLAVVGADRIARSGDVANKIGTYGVACLARLHDRPFYVAAPWSTVDLSCPDGAAIPIEQRSPEEVTRLGDRWLAPPGVGARNPAFDVTPARLVSALFTERGEAAPLGPGSLEALHGTLAGA